MANDIQRLGERIAERRRELGMSQIDVWQAGGPSNSTLTGIENGTASSVSPATLRKIDQALMWAVGSSKHILAGGEPYIYEAKPAPKDSGIQIEATDDGVRVRTQAFQIPESQITELIISNQKLMNALDDADGGELDLAELTNSAKRVAHAVLEVAASHYGGTERMKAYGQALLHSVVTNYPELDSRGIGRSLGSKAANVEVQRELDDGDHS